MTPKQGQYLAFIQLYLKLNRKAPAFRDFEICFETSPASVNGMIKKLEEKGYITKQPGVPRSIRLNIKKEDIPKLA